MPPLVLNAFCESFLAHNSLSYFQYCKMYEDKTPIILVNNVKLFKGLLENQYGLYFPQREQEFLFVFWDEVFPAEFTFLAKKIGVYHGITLSKKDENGFTFTSYAMRKEHLDPASRYLNIKKALITFSDGFAKNSIHLLKIAEKYEKGLLLK